MPNKDIGLDKAEECSTLAAKNVTNSGSRRSSMAQVYSPSGVVQCILSLKWRAGMERLLPCRRQQARLAVLLCNKRDLHFVPKVTFDHRYFRSPTSNSSTPVLVPDDATVASIDGWQVAREIMTY